MRNDNQKFLVNQITRLPVTRYKPLRAVPSKSYKTKSVNISQSNEQKLRQLLSTLIKAIIRKTETDKKSGILKKQETLYVMRRVGPLQYDNHSVSSGYMLKRITKKDWRNAINQSKQNVLKISEYVKLNEFLDAILPEGQKHYPTVFAQRIVEEYYDNKLTTSRIRKIINLFLSDLKGQTPRCYADVEIFGLHMGSRKIPITKNLSIDRVKTKDLEFVKPLGFEGFDEPFPSAYFRFAAKNYSELNMAIKKTIIALRLFKLGSIKQGRKHTHTESILFRGGGTQYPGNFERKSMACVLNTTDCKTFPVFWKKLGKYITLDTNYVFGKKFNYLNTAFDRFSESLLKGEAESRISNAIMCLEALFLHENNEEISFRLRNRIARLLVLYNFPPDKILKNISLAYSIRSAYVHGSELPKDNQKKLKKIHSSKYLAQETLLKIIQEYARISLLSFIVFNKDKRELIKLLDLAQIDDVSLKKFKNHIMKIKKAIGTQPKFEPFNLSK